MTAIALMLAIAATMLACGCSYVLGYNRAVEYATKQMCRNCKACDPDVSGVLAIWNGHPVFVPSRRRMPVPSNN